MEGQCVEGRSRLKGRLNLVRKLEDEEFFIYSIFIP